MTALLVLGILTVLYVLPLIIAGARNAPDVGSVAVVNLLLGWTVIGWVVALALAFRTPRAPYYPSWPPPQQRGPR